MGIINVEYSHFIYMLFDELALSNRFYTYRMIQKKCLTLKVHVSIKLLYLNPTPVEGGHIPPPAEKWQLLLKIMILKSPNLVNFFGKCQEKAKTWCEILTKILFFE